jgi:hypothetical protein
VLWIQDVYSGSRILIFIPSGFWISDHGSRVQQQHQKRKRKKHFVLPFFVATNIIKLLIILFLNRKRIFFSQNTKNYSPCTPFYPEICHLAIKKYGFGIRDPGSEKKPIPNPGSWVKKASDPGSAKLIKRSSYNTV